MVAFPEDLPGTPCLRSQPCLFGLSTVSDDRIAVRHGQVAAGLAGVENQGFWVLVAVQGADLIDLEAPG